MEAVWQSLILAEERQLQMVCVLMQSGGVWAFIGVLDITPISRRIMDLLFANFINNSPIEVSTKRGEKNEKPYHKNFDVFTAFKYL